MQGKGSVGLRHRVTYDRESANPQISRPLVPIATRVVIQPKLCFGLEGIAAELLEKDCRAGCVALRDERACPFEMERARTTA